MEIIPFLKPELKGFPLQGSIFKKLSSFVGVAFFISLFGAIMKIANAQ